MSANIPSNVPSSEFSVIKPKAIRAVPHVSIRIDQNDYIPRINLDEINNSKLVVKIEAISKEIESSTLKKVKTAAYPRKKWTKEEDDLLLELFIKRINVGEELYSWKYIAGVMGRSEKSVKHKWLVLKKDPRILYKTNYFFKEYISLKHQRFK